MYSLVVTIVHCASAVYKAFRAWVCKLIAKLAKFSVIGHGPVTTNHTSFSVTDHQSQIIFTDRSVSITRN